MHRHHRLRQRDLEVDVDHRAGTSARRLRSAGGIEGRAASLWRTLARIFVLDACYHAWRMVSYRPVSVSVERWIHLRVVALVVGLSVVTGAKIPVGSQTAQAESLIAKLGTDAWLARLGSPDPNVRRG